MNCYDVLATIVEPATPLSDQVREHLGSCPSCRAQLSESRRVASLLVDLPSTAGTDIVSRVMARIGYGNGRPMRDKILEQLERVRDELDTMIEEADGQIYRRPTAGEPSVAELAAHLPSAEAMENFDAERLLASRRSADVADASAAIKQAPAESFVDGAGHGHTTGDGSASMEELRRVRDRTLRLVSGVDPKLLDEPTAELLRQIYRHEADHVAQMGDTLWRLRRKDQLAESGDGP